MSKTAKRTTLLIMAAAMLVASTGAFSQTPSGGEGWLSSRALVLHGNPRNSSKIFLRSHAESGAKFHVVLVIESGGKPNIARSVILTLDGEEKKVPCKLLGTQSVFQQIEADPQPIEVSGLEATSDCALDEELFQQINSASKIELMFETDNEPLKKKVLKKGHMKKLTQLKAMT